MHDPDTSQFALSWLQLIVFAVASSSLGFPGFHQQCINWFHSCAYVIMQYILICDCALLENKLTTTTTTTTTTTSTTITKATATFTVCGGR